MPQGLFNQYFHLWANQLHREFEDICWSHQVKLPTPIIDIVSSIGHLGEWLPAEQTIRISSDLIIKHPWPVTINVLKHEMAHQLCSTRGLDAGHGPHFQAACVMLGVPAVYRSARGDSPEVFTDLETASEMVQEGRRFFAKVEKLLALGRSSNEHEAALAMQKANELIEKYNLQQTTTEQERRYAHTIINRHKKRIEVWQKSICAILTNFFYTKIIYASIYDPLSDEKYKTIEIFGRAENVAVAEYCYHFLERELESLWQMNRGRFQGRTITEKRSYWLGVLHGFRKKLQSQAAAKPGSGPRPAANTTSALVVAADLGLEAFVSQQFPRLRSIRQTGPSINRTTYDHGATDGHNIVLHKGVDGQDGNRGRLLPSAKA